MAAFSDEHRLTACACQEPQRERGCSSPYVQELASLDAVVARLRGQIRGAAADGPCADGDGSYEEGLQAKAAALRAQLQAAAEAMQVGPHCSNVNKDMCCRPSQCQS